MTGWSKSGSMLTPPKVHIAILNGIGYDYPPLSLSLLSIVVKKTSSPKKAGTSLQPPSPVKYSFTFITHPRAVTGLVWRKTSVYMKRYVGGCG